MSSSTDNSPKKASKSKNGSPQISPFKGIDPNSPVTKDKPVSAQTEVQMDISPDKENVAPELQSPDCQIQLPEAQKLMMDAYKQACNDRGNGLADVIRDTVWPDTERPKCLLASDDPTKRRKPQDTSHEYGRFCLVNLDVYPEYPPGYINETIEEMFRRILQYINGVEDAFCEETEETALLWTRPTEVPIRLGRNILYQAFHNDKVPEAVLRDMVHRSNLLLVRLNATPHQMLLFQRASASVSLHMAVHGDRRGSLTEQDPQVHRWLQAIAVPPAVQMVPVRSKQFTFAKSESQVPPGTSTSTATSTVSKSKPKCTVSLGKTTTKPSHEMEQRRLQPGSSWKEATSYERRDHHGQFLGHTATLFPHGTKFKSTDGRTGEEDTAAIRWARPGSPQRAPAASREEEGKKPFRQAFVKPTQAPAVLPGTIRRCLFPPEGPKPSSVSSRHEAQSSSTGTTTNQPSSAAQRSTTQTAAAHRNRSQAQPVPAACQDVRATRDKAPPQKVRHYDNSSSTSTSTARQTIKRTASTSSVTLTPRSTKQQRQSRTSIGSHSRRDSQSSSRSTSSTRVPEKVVTDTRRVVLKSSQGTSNATTSSTAHGASTSAAASTSQGQSSRPSTFPVANMKDYDSRRRPTLLLGDEAVSSPVFRSVYTVRHQPGLRWNSLLTITNVDIRRFTYVIFHVGKYDLIFTSDIDVLTRDVKSAVRYFTSQYPEVKFYWLLPPESKLTSAQATTLSSWRTRVKRLHLDLRFILPSQFVTSHYDLYTAEEASATVNRIDTQLYS